MEEVLASQWKSGSAANFDPCTEEKKISSDLQYSD
jgi:hypothetical protein